MAENKKPDYTDLDWTDLVRDRTVKWRQMLDQFAAENIRPIDIWEHNAPKLFRPDGFRAKLFLLPVLPVLPGKPRGTFIVCAGGGFKFQSSNEAKPVAEFFHRQGFNAAVLDYYTNAEGALGDEDTQIRAAEDGLRAIRYLRCHTERLGISPDKIAIGGFSAGGMLSNLAATRYDAGNTGDSDPVERVSSRPDAALLLYGASTPASAGGSMLGYDAATQKEKAALSPEKNLKPDSPPYFMFQTAADHPSGMLTMAAELSGRGIPFVMHLFRDGPHGGGLYDGKSADSSAFPHTAKWAELAADWLHDLDFA